MIDRIIRMKFLGSFAIVIVLVLGLPLISRAQAPATRQPQMTSSERLERYLKFAHPVGTVKLKFVGPNGGYMLAELPVREPQTSHDTIVVNRYFLLDLSVGGEGLYLAPDTITTTSDKIPLVFPITKDHAIHATLVASHSREELRELEPNFRGVIGYGMLKQFVTVFDFVKGELTFYPLYANVDIALADKNTIQAAYLDDAVLTYCHCPFPTVWLEADAPPLKPGRVHLAFASPESAIFTPALTDELLDKVKAEMVPNPKTGKKPKVGFTIGEFRIAGINIARLEPKRQIEDLPPLFRDLNIPVLGTIGNDLLRNFSGLIFDPSRTKVIFVR